jgi:hypothetical protein
MENSGNFTEARKQLFQTAIKASFKLCRNMKSFTPSIKTFLHLFDHCIKPIALYGCENWGVILNITQKRKERNLYDIFKEWESEKVNLKFCKYMLRVSKKCTNIAVLTELGRFHMYIDILKQMLMYLHRLEHSPSNLLNRAFSEYKNNTNQDSNSWYSNLLLYSKINKY